MRFFLRVLPSRDLLAVQPIRWLVLSRFCASIFFYSTTIVLFQHQRGLNFTAMFLMESILSGAIWVADVPTSIWADRFGYRRVIILGSLWSIAGMVLFALAHGFWMFALANVLGGFSIACTSGCESALLYRSLTTEMRAKQGDAAFALLRMASTCGLFLGLTTGSFIGAFSPTLAVVASIVPLIGSLVAAWRIQEPQIVVIELVTPLSSSASKILEAALKTIRRQPVLIGLQVFSSAAFSLSNAIFWFNQPYFTRAGIPVIWFGPVMGIAMGCQLFVVVRMTALLQRVGARVMLILSCLLPGLAYILLTQITRPFPAIALVTCVVAFSAWQGPLVDNRLNQYVDDESRATTLSALSLIGSLIGIVLNLWIGSLGDQGLITTGLGIGMSLVLLCVLVPFVVKRPMAKM
jgi:MFS family permease